jgi:hypothetical protein
MFKTRKSLVWMVAALLLLGAPVFAQDAMTPAVEVSDQAIVDGTVTVDRVVSDGPGWIVIHADNNGAPGAVIGWTAVQDGENLDVVVEIDTDAATETLYAMLHADLGVEGTYEFPGADVPVQVDGQVVTPAFTVTGLAQAEPTATPEATATPEVTATEDVTPTDVVTATDEPGQLPETGGSATPWTPIVLVGLGLVLLVVGSLVALRRTSDVNVRD